MEVLCILGVAGSLRRGSYNRALLRAAQELLPEGMTLELFDLRDIPPYDMDVEQQGLPTPVVAWKEAIRRADALLIATPEHNWSVPGVLKNAIDWASRPPGDNVFQGKPVAIMGASTGLYGTVRAQLHLRQVLASVDAYVLNRPQVLVARAQDKFDAEGRLIDEPTRALVRNLLTALRDWTLRLRKPSPRDG
jgi:chromate reductase